MPDPIHSTSVGRGRRPYLETPAQAPRPRPRRSRFLLVGLPVFAVFAAFGSIVWLAYVDSTAGTAVGEPPLIKADTSPLKVEPDDPGGRVVADQGEVRELFRDDPAPRLERLLPPPEEPLTPGGEAAPTVTAAAEEDGASGLPAAVEEGGQGEAPAPPAAAEADVTDEADDTDDAGSEGGRVLASGETEGTVTSNGPAAEPEQRAEQAAAEAEAALETLLAEVTGRSRPGEAGPAPPPAVTAQPADRQQQQQAARPGQSAAPPASTPEQTAARQQDPAPAREAASPQRVQRPASAPAGAQPVPVEPAPAGTQVAATGPSYRIQLAAVREEADARRAWDLFQLDLGDVLAGVDPVIERAETANGVFYRVQVGGFTDLAAAESLCDELKRRNASCFVIRR